MRRGFVAGLFAATVVATCVFLAERVNEATAPELPANFIRVKTPLRFMCADAREGHFFAYNAADVKRSTTDARCVTVVDDEGVKRSLCNQDKEFVTCLQIK